MKILIIGGVAGGATAAARLRRLSETAEIIVFEKGEHVSFANCGLPYYIGGTIGNRESVLLQTPKGFNDRYNIDVRVNSELLQICRVEKKVVVRNLVEGTDYEETYDKLILSPGAKPFLPPINGIDNIGIFTLRDVKDSDAIKDFIAQKKCQNAVVVGAGYIGLEMVENLADLGLNVSVIERENQVLPVFDWDTAKTIELELKKQRCFIIFGKRIG